MSHSARYRGVFPVVPTTFTEAGELDLHSQKRCVDFMIDAGSHGLCILANFSEQFAVAGTGRKWGGHGFHSSTENRVQLFND